MLEWLAENHLSVSALVNTGMLLVWMVYLGVFLRQYIRQTRPRILISEAAGNTLDANCFITNMSSEPIYLEAISVTLESEDNAWSGSAIEVRAGDDGFIPDDPLKRTHQGPVRPAEYLTIGTFRSLLDRVADENQEFRDKGRVENATLNVKVYADYASEDLVIGAERRFRLSGNGKSCRVLALGRSTNQIRSHTKRRRAEAELQRQLRLQG